MKRSVNILVLVLLFHYSFAQNIYSVKGYVTNSITGEALIGATVYCPTIIKGCTTNEFGFYSLTLKATDSIMVVASFVGCRSVSKKIIQNGFLNFELLPGVNLDEVVVGYQSGEIVSRENSNVLKLDMKTIKQLPSIFGENDLIQAIRLLPGVQSGSEGKSQLFVRGGSPDQNLMLLDDVPLYYISHFGGFFSVFNSDALNSVELTKGGFPARYGGRLSSILNVRMKEGNLNYFAGNATIGLLSSRLQIEGPVSKGKSSYLLSVRKSVLPIMSIIADNLKSGFYDLNGKINFKIDLNNRIFVSFYNGRDNTTINYYEVESGSNVPYFSNRNYWGHLMGALRWNHVFSDKLFGNLILSSVQYKYVTDLKFQETSDDKVYYTNDKLSSGITDVNANYIMNWYINPQYTISGGTNNSLHLFIPNNEFQITKTTDEIVFDTTHLSQINAFESSLYVENSFEFKYVEGNIGTRLASYFLEDKPFLYFEPRVMLAFKFNEKLKVNVAYTKMNQFIHLLSYSNTDFPNDYWMPSTSGAKPENAVQYSLGINCNVFNGYSISLVAYNKQLKNLVAFKEGESLYGAFDGWENVIEIGGIGYSKGVELLFQKLSGKTTGWVSTTVSKTERTFQNINNSISYPFKYDKLLDISLVVNHDFGNDIILSAVWNYGSGYPVTLAAGKYIRNSEEEILIWDDRNSSRMRDNHRLDVSLSFPYKIGQINGQFGLSILNVYNRKNPYYYYYEESANSYQLYQQSLIPFLPSISYSFKF